MDRLNFTLRIPRELRDTIDQDAAASGVSSNQRILEVLLEKYKQENGLERRMSELEKMMHRLLDREPQASQYQ